MSPATVVQLSHLTVHRDFSGFGRKIKWTESGRVWEEDHGLLLFDVGKLRVQRGLPRDLARMTEWEPIAGLHR